jgi:NTE family protein
MTTAFVLSGGGIRGPLQVGALAALMERGIFPDMMVGTSAGSLNSGFLAAHGPTLDSIPCLMDAWRSATREVVYPGNLFTIAGRLIDNADGLFPTEGMRKLIASKLPPGVTTYGQCKIPCYLTAVDLGSRKLFLFGEDPDSPLVDGMMASSVIPVLQPPLDYHGLQLVDGGVLAEVPCSVAMDKGATTIYAINVGGGEGVLPPVHGIFNIFMRTLEAWLLQSFFLDLKRADDDPAIELHHIQITAFKDLSFNDFSKTEDQFVAGKETAIAYLDNPKPRMLARAAAGEGGISVPGAREYVLPQNR